MKINPGRKVCAYAFIVFASAGLMSFGSVAHADITINYTVGSALQSDPQSVEIIAAFQRAGARWTSVFSNTATLNFNIDFSDLGANTLGETGSVADFYSYSSFRSALSANTAKSSDDLTALSFLASGPNYSLLTNRTSDNPNGSGSATPYTYSLADTLRINNANAKVLGIYSGSADTSDASIKFNNLFRPQFDFNSSDGINSNQFDFEGIAAHEIGHALGFVSGVDILDGNTGFPASVITDYVNPLDFFRFSTGSATTAGGVLDWTADTRAKFFSLDKGATNIAEFSTGRNFGDGQQASHWKDVNPIIGIMDPTIAQGQAFNISNTDLRAFDAIGYNINFQPVPAPSAVVSVGIGGMVGLLGIGTRKLRRVMRRSNNA